MADTVAQGPWSDYSAPASATPVTAAPAAGAAGGPWSDYAAPSPAETAAGSVLGDFGVSPGAAKEIVGGAEDIGSLVANTGIGAVNTIDYGLQRAGGASPQEAAAKPAMQYVQPGPAGQQVEQQIENLAGLATGSQGPNGQYQTKSDTIGGDITQAKQTLADAYASLQRTDPDTAARLAHAAPDIQNLINLAPAAGAAHLMGEGAEDAAAALARPEDTTPPVAPPKAAPGPITPEHLQAQPDRLPPPPERNTVAAAPSPGASGPEAPPSGAAPRVPVPGKPHIRPKAGAPVEVAPVAAPTEAAPLAAPKTDEAEVAQGTAPNAPEKQARLSAIQQLQADTGAVMPNVRLSAIDGDYRETGTDYQLGELGDPDMKQQLDQEQNALKAASQQQVRSTGGVADGVEQPALQERGQIIDKALQGISGWFDRNIRSLYGSGDATAAQRPVSLNPNPQGRVGAFDALLKDHSQFTGTEGMQLHQDVQRVAQQFGLMGQGGFWSPTSLENAERFRQWLGEQYTPRTGRTIGRLKDALDSDIAAQGGAGVYDKARALRFKRDQMLTGPGIGALMPERLPTGRLDRSVDVDKIADHIANAPKEDFDHIVNVLHDSSKLGDGELAKDNAAALNEIRRHMAERLNAAGTKQRDGFWDPYAYHDQLNKYSTKLPAIFSPEGIRRFQTIHDAGNALRVNKRYPGAAKQIMQAQGVRARLAPHLAGAIEGAATGWLGPIGGAVGEMTGISGAIRKGVGRVVAGDSAAAQAERVGKRLQPLGQRFPKQGGWIGDLRKSKLPAVTHEYDPESRTHTVRSPNGYTTAQQRGNDIQINNTHTDPAAQGSGEAVARMSRLADEAHAQGGTLQSDTEVSRSGQKPYKALAHLGYDVQHNTAVDRSEAGIERSENGRPVFTVGPQKRPPLRQNYDPAAGIYDAQVKRDVEAAHANPNAPRPGLVQEGHVVGGPRGLAGKFPGQRGGPKVYGPKASFGGAYTADDIRRAKNNFTSQFGHDPDEPLTSDYEMVPISRLVSTEKTEEPRVQSLMAAMREESPFESKIPPIVADSRGAILDGHNRFEAATRLGLKEVPVIERYARTEGPQLGTPLAAKFPGQRGGPKFERQAETGKDGPAEYKASPALNAFIRSRAPAHVVDPNGPATWDELKARGAESPMPINPQEAEGSIYKDTPTNIAFRAWHDSLHLKYNGGFDHEGELQTALAHQEEAKAAGLSQQDRAALWADTWNTFEHHEKTGEFPKNPRQFVAQKLAEDKPQAQLNIGLHVGNPDEGGHVLDPAEAIKDIKKLGYKVGKTSVVQSNTEPTLVADIHGAPMVHSDLDTLSQRLGQGAIAQRLNDGSGMLEGPKADEWGGAYNPDYFRTHEGHTATQQANQTVTNPQRMAYPGIYDKPADILSRVKVAPEDPILKQLFGVTRKDLHDAAVNRTSNMRYDLPGGAKKPKGSAAANGVMNDKNAQRLVDLINEAKKNPELYHGMAGWYVMDPLFKKVVDTVGRKAAPATYSRLNAFMGMASPGSDVNSEINRGTAANMMATQGEFEKFAKYGGRPAGARGKPPELAAVTGHPYHGTAQVPAMRRFLESGTVEGKTPKVPTYIAASGVPETGFQNHLLVGDSHWSRGVGLSDTRTGETKVYGSVSTPEVQQLHPWYKEKVAKATGLPPTSAQAVQWGALSHETGVETPVGAPKLELFAQQVRKAAARLKITPEEALKRIILGTAHAG